ncbi:MAG: DciA family protein [Prevotella sp.]
MFKREVKSITDLLDVYLRNEGLETPLLQKRLIDSWSKVTGRTVERYTVDKFIRNQTLFVKISNPALRSDLMMMRGQIVKRLNAEVRSQVIVDIRFV